MRMTQTKSAQSELMAALRKRPDDVDRRLQLFRYAVIDGNWERADQLLETAVRLDAALENPALAYRSIINAERMRANVFRGTEPPVFLGPPPSWAACLVRALQTHDDSAGAALAATALQEAPAVGGTINAEPFAWLADADSRLGPLLEAFIDGKYYWIPFEHLARISLEAPGDLLDLAWFPCELGLSNGGSCMGYIPARYPGSERTDRDDVKLARLTEWQPWSDTTQQGLGQRMFISDQGDYALLDCREILFAAGAAPQPA